MEKGKLSHPNKMKITGEGTRGKVTPRQRRGEGEKTRKCPKLFGGTSEKIALIVTIISGRKKQRPERTLNMSGEEKVKEVHNTRDKTLSKGYKNK